MTLRTRLASRWGGTASLALLVLVVRWPGLARLPLNVDEPLYLATLQVPDSLLSLYRDTLFTKPILAALYYQAALWSDHPYVALWWITTALIVVATWCVAATTRRLAGDPTLGLLAGAFFCAMVNRAPTGVASAQIEHLVNALVAVGMYTMVAWDPRRPATQLAAACLAVLLALTKQYLVVFVVAFAFAAGSWELLVWAGFAVLLAFGTHFVIFADSVENMARFTRQYYPPDPLAGGRALAQFVARALALLLPAGVLYFRSASGAPGTDAVRTRLTAWCAKHRVPLAFLIGGAITVFATKGWPPHLLLLLPPVAVLLATAIGTLVRDDGRVLALYATGVLVLLGIGMRRTATHDARAFWTEQRVTAEDYVTALTFTQAYGANRVYQFPSPLPEFYFDARVRAAGFDPENDHRMAIGSSHTLQDRFAAGFQRHRPELCVEIAPRPGNERFVDPAYARFVHELVAGSSPMVFAHGGVRAYDCRQRNR